MYKQVSFHLGQGKHLNISNDNLIQSCQPERFVGITKSFRNANAWIISSFQWHWMQIADSSKLISDAF